MPHHLVGWSACQPNVIIDPAEIQWPVEAALNCLQGEFALPTPGFNVVAAGILNAVLLEKLGGGLLGKERCHPLLQLLPVEGEEEVVAVCLQAVVADRKDVTNAPALVPLPLVFGVDRKSTRLNSSHRCIS